MKFHSHLICFLEDDDIEHWFRYGTLFTSKTVFSHFLSTNKRIKVLKVHCFETKLHVKVLSVWWILRHREKVM